MTLLENSVSRRLSPVGDGLAPAFGCVPPGDFAPAPLSEKVDFLRIDVKHILEDFCACHAPGCEVVYVGDTGNKSAVFNEALASSLGIVLGLTRTKSK